MGHCFGEDSSDLLRHNFIVCVIDTVAAYPQLDCNFSFLAGAESPTVAEVVGATSTIYVSPKEATT